MKFINPSEISSKIMTLIDEADSRMILITPYCKFSNWIILEQKLREAIDRKIEIEFYIRDGESNESLAEVRSLGIEPHLVKNLHAKLYFNEKQAIVTSMNFPSSSETDSLELGYITECAEEYSELMSFFNRYIKCVDLQNEIGLNSEFHKKNNDWLTPLILNLNAHNASPSEVLFKGNSLNIKIAADEYNCFIDNEKGIFLRMKLEISKKDYRNFVKFKHLIEKKSKLTVELFEGDGHHSSSIWGQTTSRLKTKNLNLSIKEEIETIISQITNFIITIQEVRQELSENQQHNSR
jgi:hypothetical protein